MRLDMRRFQNEVHEWEVHNFGMQDAYLPLLGVVEEVGELCHAHLKRAQKIRAVERGALVDAVGDVMVFLAAYCARIGVDLEDAITITWESVKKRDWRRFPKNGRTE